MVRRHSGFTLLETLIGLALTGMLLALLASGSLAFMRVSREGEVAQRLQRELVFAVEAIDSELRIARDVTETVAGTEWSIAQIIYDHTNSEFDDRLVLLRFDETTGHLKLGSRTLSRNVGAFSLQEPVGRPDVRQLSIETIGQMAMVSSGNLPLRLETQVVLRNFWFGAEPGGPSVVLVVMPNDPEYQRNNQNQNWYNSITLSWTTSLPTTYILLHQDPTMAWQTVDRTGIAPQTVHSYTLSSQGQSRYLVDETYGWNVTVFHNEIQRSTGDLSC